MERALTRQAASDAAGALGWRLVLGTLRASVPVRSLAQAARIASEAVAACGADADRHLRVDLRAERVVFTLRSADQATVTARDTELAQLITGVIRIAGPRTEPDVHADAARSVQLLEIAIDAVDIVAVRPFWKAVLGYVDEAGATGPEDAIVDPVAQGPAVWFQQMSEPRTERNRIHLDISVPHDEASQRIDAALAAGGHLVSDADTPAFWVLADREGNEACVTTWQGRDG